MQSKEKMLMEIGNALQQQYEDGRQRQNANSVLISSDDLETLRQLRKVARGDRLLFHYNGHGVPEQLKMKFGVAKHYTHYMPVSVSDLRSWLESQYMS